MNFSDALEQRDDPSIAHKLDYLADGETIFTYRAYVVRGPECADQAVLKVRLYEWGKTLADLLGCSIVDSYFTCRDPRIEDPAPLDTVLVYRVGLKRNKCCCKGNS